MMLVMLTPCVPAGRKSARRDDQSQARLHRPHPGPISAPPMPLVPARSRRLRKIATVGGLCLAIGVMTTLVSYSVTLYRLFCEVTGAGGTTQRATTADAAQTARTVTVWFNTDIAPGMPWRFAAVQRSVTVHLGEEALVFFTAENLSDQPVVGHATFNVTPDKTGLYFKKIECF